MGWDDSAPTAQELNTGGWDSTPPTAQEIGKPQNIMSRIFNPSPAQRTSDNAKMAEAANNPVTGMEDPVYKYGVGFLGPTSGLKGIANLLKSGKATISGFLSSEHGIHPIIEAAEEAGQVAPSSPFAKDIFSGGGSAAPAVTAAPETGQAMKQIFDPFTKTTKMVPATTAAAPEAVAATPSTESPGMLSKLMKTAHLGTSSNAVGAAIGGYAAHKAGMPEVAGAIAGGLAGPMAVKAFIKTQNGLMPIWEVNQPFLSQEGRAAISTFSKNGDDNDSNK